MLTGGIRSRGAMDALLAAGIVDVIGLARPLAMQPDLPARLLRGEVDTVELPDHRVPGPLELAGESEWYEAQLARLADGREADPDLDHLRMSLAFLAGEAMRGLRDGRRRRQPGGPGRAGTGRSGPARLTRRRSGPGALAGPVP